LLLTVNNPRDNRKQKAHRYATRQHADDALERPKHTPLRWETEVAASERGITTRGEVDRRVPRCKQRQRSKVAHGRISNPCRTTTAIANRTTNAVKRRVLQVFPSARPVEDGVCAPFEASQRRFEPSSTAIIRPALTIVHNDATCLPKSKGCNSMSFQSARRPSELESQLCR
jgi:hypothetical protein